MFKSSKVKWIYDCFSPVVPWVRPLLVIQSLLWFYEFVVHLGPTLKAIITDRWMDLLSTWHDSVFLFSFTYVSSALGAFSACQGWWEVCWRGWRVHQDKEDGSTEEKWTEDECLSELYPIPDVAVAITTSRPPVCSPITLRVCPVPSPVTSLCAAPCYTPIRTPVYWLP